MREALQTQQARGGTPARSRWTRAQAWALMLLSAFGVVGAGVLWLEAGLAYAALAYAVTIALLYGLVVRLLGRGAAAGTMAEGGGGAPTLVVPPAPPMRSRSEPPPVSQ
jgi:hypothetical protein